MTAVIIGARGGIGAALTRELVARGTYARVLALSRAGDALPVEGAEKGFIDVADEDSITAAAALAQAADPIRLVVVATGVLTVDGVTSPEKTYRQQTRTAFERVFALNTIGPALIAKHFLPRLPREQRTVFAALSARVGSITDNRIGGWHAYRASKAALNMLVKTYAIEQTRRNPDSIIVSLHPGTVDTALSQPFQANVPERQLVSPQSAATNLLDVIKSLTPSDTGKVFDCAGAEIAP